PRPPASTPFPYTTLFRSALGYGFWRLSPETEPLRRWVAGEREGIDPAAAWRVAVALPFRLVRRGEKQAVLIVAVPASAFTTAELDRKSTRLNSSHSQISY